MHKAIKFGTLVLIVGMTFTSCKKKEGCTDPLASNYDSEAEKDNSSCILIDPELAVRDQIVTAPTAYTFVDKAGNNTVSYSGQQDRLDMLSEIKSYSIKPVGDAAIQGDGVSIEASVLKEMFANSSNPFLGTDKDRLNASSKQLKNKASNGDATVVAYAESLFDQLGTASNSADLTTELTSTGTAGVLRLSDSKAYFVNANGLEFAQIIEKGLMGAVFYFQISQVYLGEEKMGDVDGIDTDGIDLNAKLSKDKTTGALKAYTAMEHHWDEAFGYFSYEADYPVNGTDRFIGKYAASRNSALQSSDKLLDAYIAGRVAIVNKDMVKRNEQITIIRKELGRVFAGSAINYLKACVTLVNEINGGALSAEDKLKSQANLVHKLSEVTGFIYSLQFGYESNFTSIDVTTAFALIGANFYTSSSANLQTVIANLKDKIGFTQVEIDAL